MVKFSLIILASALAAVDAARGGPVRKTFRLDNRSFRRGDPSTEALLKKARPFSTRRHLQDGAAFDGSFNLKFSRCVDVKMYDEQLFESEDLIEDVKEGNVASVKSYVLFHVCEADTCTYDAEDDLYVIDLPTYLSGVAQYHANKRNDYCTHCEMFADTCNPVADEENEAAGGENVEEAAGGDDEEEAADGDDEEEAAGGDDEKEEGDQQGQEEQNNEEQNNEQDQGGQAEGDQEVEQGEEPAEGMSSCA